MKFFSQFDHHGHMGMGLEHWREKFSLMELYFQIKSSEYDRLMYVLSGGPHLMSYNK
jgi:hypothetical protein